LIRAKNEKLTEEQILILIDDTYHNQLDGVDISSSAGGGGVQNSSSGGAKDSVLMYNGKIYDEKKRAIYGIQRSKAQF
jgi:hypothetical protein